MSAESGETPDNEAALPNDGEMANGKQKYRGRLELTWTNKDEALLSRDDGSYEWVPKRDHRVKEVRLLRDAGIVGEVHPEADRARDNLLIRGDALHVLTALNSLPEFAAEYAGKVKLVYIDPPFNTGQAFDQYDDGLEHSVWLTMMRDRLEQIKELLSPDGSVWVHLDDAEMAYCKVMMDDIFGRENFIATIVWESAPGGRGDTDIASTHDYIMVFASDATRWAKVRNGLPRNETQLDRFKNPDNDPRGPWRQGDDGTAKSGGANSRWPITLPSGRVIKPKEGRYWAFSKETFDTACEENRVWFGKDGDSLPIIKRYLSEVNTEIAPKSWWASGQVGSNQEAKRDHLSKLFPDKLPFATPKPERLLQRIIHISTDPGDIVLDCFGGSGSTAAVAHKMGRRWVTCELSRETLDEHTAPRLQKVVNGEDPGGISSTETRVAVGDLPDDVAPEDAARFTSLLAKFAPPLVEPLEDDDELSAAATKFVAALRKAARTRKEVTHNWSGGGGFRILDVAPSMYEEDAGIVVLADWAERSELAEVVAAQLGFAYEPDPPFHGKHGRMRLAVIDGHVDEAAVRLLVRALPEGQRLSLAATSLDPEAAELLAKLKSGSQARVVPQDILLAYRTPARWRAKAAAISAEAGFQTEEKLKDVRLSDEAVERLVHGETSPTAEEKIARVTEGLREVIDTDRKLAEWTQKNQEEES